jgi:RNA polymerase II subunit A C-terminal domain phosphatase
VRLYKNDPILTYEYTSKVKHGSRYTDEETEVETKLTGRFSTELEGNIDKVWLKVGQLLTGPADVCDVAEDCKHEVIYGGLCTNCGKEMSEEDTVERAPLSIAHHTAAFTVSQDQADEIDTATKKRLLNGRKLSLVVDLDQTVLHAACEPTIAEWQKDPDNPNYEAVKDIEAFQLKDSGRDRIGTYYYIKQRPGLQDFLKSMSELYELHIYTMGTRQYAKNVVNLIDKTGEYFQDRILSRDESGSMIAKSLSRLFPVDTNMVVIIDDRGDIWDHSPNLVRVKAYDFYRGIGDINAAFLPKKQEIPLDPDQKPDTPLFPSPDTTEHKANGVDQANGADDEKKAPVESSLTTGDLDNPEVLEAQTKEQEKQIDAQIEERPLERLQREQDQKDEAEAAANASPSPNGEPQPSQSTESESDSSDTSESNKLVHRHAVLNNDDEELILIEDKLRKVHTAWFREYDKKRHSTKGGRVGELSGSQKASVRGNSDQPLDLSALPDAKKILTQMKTAVLGGVVIVFSGVLPLGSDPFSNDTARWATTFGARIAEEVTSETTHVVAAKMGTTKVHKARKMPNVKVVKVAWLMDSMQKWRRQDENFYLLEGVNKRKSGHNDNDARWGDLEPITNSVMTDSEEDVSGIDTGDERPNKRPRINTTDIDADVEADDSFSPEDIGEVDWDAADAELAEFMGSDVDSGSDTESVTSSLSVREKRASKRSRDSNELNGEDGTRSSRNSHLRAVSTFTDDDGDPPPAGILTAEQKAKEEAEKARQAEEDDELLKEFEEGLEAE